jgi:hypothetical protein
MSRPTILALSAALTAFVLIFAGAAASYAVRPGPSPGAKAPDTIPVDVVRAREAEYRRLIDTANARLRAQPAAVAQQIARAPARVSVGDLEGEEDHQEISRQRPARSHQEEDDG